MRLNFHDHYRPANDVVFMVIYGRRGLFRWLMSAVTGNTLKIDIVRRKKCCLVG